MFILGQLNPIHGVLLDQYNPILVFIQLSPVHGVIMGFKEPNTGFGRTFPIWENPVKSQMIPTNFPLLTQFGNFEKFPVLILKNHIHVCMLLIMQPGPLLIITFILNIPILKKSKMHS